MGIDNRHNKAFTQMLESKDIKRVLIIYDSIEFR